MKRLAALILSIAATGVLALATAAPAGAQLTGVCVGFAYAQVHLIYLAPSNASTGLAQVQAQALDKGCPIEG